MNNIDWNIVSKNLLSDWPIALAALLVLVLILTILTTMRKFSWSNRTLFIVSLVITVILFSLYEVAHYFVALAIANNDANSWIDYFLKLVTKQ